MWKTDSLYCTSETNTQHCKSTMKVKVKSFSRVQLFVTPWTIVYQPLPLWNFPTRILVWVATSFPRGSSSSRDQTWVLPHCRQTSKLPWKPFGVIYALIKKKKLLKDNDQGTQSQCSGTTQRDRVGMRRGREAFRMEGTYVYLWPIHVDVWQNHHFNTVK